MPSAWMTLPAPRKSRVLNAAWVARWKTPALRTPPTPEGQHHVPELADRGVGEHALDVVLGHGDGRGEERRERAQGRDDAHGVGAGLEDRRRAGPP